MFCVKSFVSTLIVFQPEFGALRNKEDANALWTEHEFLMCFSVSVCLGARPILGSLQEVTEVHPVLRPGDDDLWRNIHW